MLLAMTLALRLPFDRLFLRVAYLRLLFGNRQAEMRFDIRPFVKRTRRRFRLRQEVRLLSEFTVIVLHRLP